MNTQDRAVVRPVGAVFETNKVLRNTYSLLALTLLFSAMTAGLSMTLNMGVGANLVSFIGSMILIWFVLPRTANSSMGIAVVFAITGLLGFGLGPLLTHYLAFSNGSQIVATAMGGTGVIFLALSGYVLTTKRDFSFLGGMLVAGFIIVLLAAVVNIFAGIPALGLAISAIVIFIMSGFILYDTSRIINGGETNYIMATVGIYLSIYNIFTSLLHLLGAFGGSDD